MRNCNKYTPFAGCSLCSLQYAPGMISNNFINNIPMEMRRKLRGSFSLFYPNVHVMLANVWMHYLIKQAFGRCINRLSPLSERGD
jgi:hypothetical protein